MIFRDSDLLDAYLKSIEDNDTYIFAYLISKTGITFIDCLSIKKSEIFIDNDYFLSILNSYEEERPFYREGKNNRSYYLKKYRRYSNGVQPLELRKSYAYLYLKENGTLKGSTYEYLENRKSSLLSTLQITEEEYQLLTKTYKEKNNLDKELLLKVSSLLKTNSTFEKELSLLLSKY